jgi:hypothetical protein
MLSIDATEEHVDRDDERDQARGRLRVARDGIVMVGGYVRLELLEPVKLVERLGKGRKEARYHGNLALFLNRVRWFDSGRGHTPKSPARVRERTFRRRSSQSAWWRQTKNPCYPARTVGNPAGR